MSGMIICICIYICILTKEWWYSAIFVFQVAAHFFQEAINHTLKIDDDKYWQTSKTLCPPFLKKELFWRGFRSKSFWFKVISDFFCCNNQILFHPIFKGSQMADQCTMCYSLSSFQPNKLRHILKFVSFRVILTDFKCPQK